MKEQMNFCVLALQNEIDSKSLFYILYYILFYICVYIHKTETVSLCFTYLVTQSCPTLCNPVDSIAHQAPLSVGIFQVRILEWVAMLSSMLSFQKFEVI